MADTRTLYLLLTITFLAFITTLFLDVRSEYKVALFTTTSLPVVYTARYFAKASVKEEELHYFKVVSLKENIIKDMVAVTTAYLIGYIIYISTTADFSSEGLILYTIAFIVVLFLRYVISVWYKSASAFVDVNNPLIIVPTAFAFALLGFAIEYFIFIGVY